MTEKRYRIIVEKRLRAVFPEAILLKPDAVYMQGLPDTIILLNGRCAALEFKRSINASVRPNQRYYINLFEEWGFGRFIYPENTEDVIADLIEYFNKNTSLYEE